MFSDEKKDELRFLFEQGRLEELLKEIISLQEKGVFVGDHRNLLSRLSKLNLDYYLNTISYEEYDREFSRIRFAIQEFDQVPSHKFISVKNQQQEGEIKLWQIIAICIPIITLAYLFITKMPAYLTLPPPTQFEPNEPIGAFPLIPSQPKSFSYHNFFGHDSLGRKCDFIVYIIREFDWVKNKIAETSKDGKRTDVCEHLKTAELVSQINDDKLLSIICFGNSSEEEDLNLPDYASRLSKEEDRAYKRAKKLADCLILQKIQPTVYLLNLGKYDEVEYDTQETAYQRQVIIIGVKRMDTFVLTDQALRNGLMTEYYGGNLNMNIEMFSRVNLEDIGLPIVHYRN